MRAVRLERWSHEMAAFFIEAHPEWLPFVGHWEAEEDGLQVNYLEINFPSQHPALADPLRLWVQLDRVIAVEWFVLPDGRRWETDWIFYLPAWIHRADWPDYNEGLRHIIGWLERFFAEEVVITYRPEPNSPIKLARTWKGTFDSVEFA